MFRTHITHLLILFLLTATLAGPPQAPAAQPLTLDLSWEASSGADRTIEFWPEPANTYSWQVRARNPLGDTYANGNAWWKFTPLTYTSGHFFKAAPRDYAMWQPLTLDLSWTASIGAEKYEYCLDTVPNETCESVWISTGTALTARVSGLAQRTVYYWQVRASDTQGTVYANWNNIWYNFTTVGPKPGAFGKSAPAIGSTDLPTSLTLTWAPSSEATDYDYCLSTTDNGVCAPEVGGLGSATYANISGLAYGTTYYWQVRARNLVGAMEANGGDWWSFDTQPAPPGAFDKFEPRYVTIGVPSYLTLGWGWSSQAIGYEYCYDVTNNGNCDTAWVSAGLDHYAYLTGLKRDTTYYWHVRAVTSGEPIYSNSNIWWSFSTMYSAFMPYMDR